VYGPNQDRIKHSDSNGRVTKYVGGIYEEVTKGGVTQKIHYVGDFALFISKGINTNATYAHEYLHRDHIGSIVAISKGKIATLADVSWQANGAWGERRFNQWNGPLDNLLIPTSTAKGFTDHEHLDAVGLIHMNGRVYDPELGRFMSADPFVQAPYNSQSYNRYSYVFNNPLSFTDPTGYTTEATKYDVEELPVTCDSACMEQHRKKLEAQQNAINQSNIAYWSASESRDQHWAYMNGAAYNLNNYWGVMLYSLAAGTQTPRNSDMPTAAEGIALGWYSTSVTARQLYPYDINQQVSVATSLAFAYLEGGLGNGVGALSIVTKSTPSALLVGRANTHVYLGFRKGIPVYVGITKSPAARQAAHAERFTLRLINKEPLTRRQARAIEQSIIEKNPQFENKINSISPSRSWYKEAREWGDNWLKENGF